ncbi:MAG: hypothetical protein RLY93_08495 [Sumerlaeia bacterium]
MTDPLDDAARALRPVTVPATGRSDREWFVAQGVLLHPPREEHVAAYAKGFALDPFEARQRLMAPAPRLLFRFGDRREAQRWVAWGRLVSAPLFLIEAEELLGFSPHPLDSLELHHNTLVLKAKDRQPVRIEADGFLCLVAGAVSAREVAERRTPESLGGGMHVTRETQAATTEWLMDFSLLGERVVFRLRGDSCDLSHIPLQVEEDGPKDFGRLLRLIRRLYPHLSVYDRFGQASQPLTDSRALLRESLEVASRSPLGSPRLAEKRVWVESEAAAFDLYSCLSRAQFLAP